MATDAGRSGFEARIALEAAPEAWDTMPPSAARAACAALRRKRRLMRWVTMSGALEQVQLPMARRRLRSGLVLQRLCVALYHRYHLVQPREIAGATQFEERHVVQYLSTALHQLPDPAGVLFDFNAEAIRK